MFVPHYFFSSTFFSESVLASVLELVDSDLQLHLDKEDEQTAQTNNFIVTLLSMSKISMSRINDLLW